jgi:hypothetical protein
MAVRLRSTSSAVVTLDKPGLGNLNDLRGAGYGYGLPPFYRPATVPFLLHPRFSLSPSPSSSHWPILSTTTYFRRKLQTI